MIGELTKDTKVESQGWGVGLQIKVLLGNQAIDPLTHHDLQGSVMVGQPGPEDQDDQVHSPMAPRKGQKLPIFHHENADGSYLS